MIKYSNEFLKQLYSQPNREVYARAISLTWDENPIVSFEGRLTGGSINIDGTSAMRRTCSVSIAGSSTKLNDYDWAYRTKFKLEIGISNQFDRTQPDIIWFNQGIFIITSFSQSLTGNNNTISLQGKDKMCLLNGDVGGNLMAPTQFDAEEVVLENNVVSIKKIPIYTIIRNAVHQFANEKYHNIIINDLAEDALELLEYKYDEPLYLIRPTSTNDIIYENGTLNGNMPVSTAQGATTLNGIKSYDNLMGRLTEGDDSIGEEIWFESSNSRYHVAKIEYGQAAGYKHTDLIYPDELILNPGEALTSMLDKLKNMLGEFEYFYDLQGRFIFQKKKNYIETEWGPNKYYNNDENILYDSEPAYIFNDSELIINFNNNPTLMNMRNDFSVWGQRPGGTNGIAIHMRYAIDEKPEFYRAFDSKEYSADEVDWREIIYQMALDYDAHNYEDNFLQVLAKNNPNHYPTGITGYEQYYIDLQGFWRQLYCPLEERDNDNRTEYGEDNWHKNVVEHPELLNFWFDFLDLNGELLEYSCKKIGDRPKVINDSSIKAIYYRETPAIIFGNALTPTKKEGYRYFQIGNMETMFSISAQTLSAKEKVDELLNEYSYATENITINTLPIYHLEPNSLIEINDSITNIRGQYSVNRISVPLTYNGNMSISAKKLSQLII